MGVGGVYPGFDLEPQPQPQNGEVSMSPSDNSTKASKLQLPLSCDPPGPGNPTKQLVWIVSARTLTLERNLRISIMGRQVDQATNTDNSRSSAAQATWAVPSSAPVSTPATSS